MKQNLTPFTWPIPEGFKVVTREGQPLDNPIVEVPGMPDNQICLIAYHNGSIHLFKKDGKCGSIDNGNDLFLTPIEKEVEIWVAAWPEGQLIAHTTSTDKGILESFIEGKNAIVTSVKVKI